MLCDDFAGQRRVAMTCLYNQVQQLTPKHLLGASVVYLPHTGTDMPDRPETARRQSSTVTLSDKDFIRRHRQLALFDSQPVVMAPSIELMSADSCRLYKKVSIR